MSGSFRAPRSPNIIWPSLSFITGANDLRCWRALKPQIGLYHTIHTHTHTHTRSHTYTYIYIYIIYLMRRRRVTGISGSRIWSKTLMEQIFNPCGQYQWCPDGPVSHSPHLLAKVPGIYSDLLRSVQMLKREWVAESNWKLPHLFISNKTATLVPEFAVEDLLWAELQPWCLSLQWKTCPCNDDIWWTNNLILLHVYICFITIFIQRLCLFYE